MTKDQIIAKPEPFGHLHDGNGNQPLTFERGPVPVDRSISCSTMEVFTLDQMKAFASLVAAQAAAEEREECAIEASSWKCGKLLLHAGEMTAQERRSCEAVSAGIAAAIRQRGMK